MEKHIKESSSENLGNHFLGKDLNEMMDIFELLIQSINLIFKCNETINGLTKLIDDNSNDTDNPLVGSILLPKKPNSSLTADNTTIDSRNKFNLQKKAKSSSSKGDFQYFKLSPSSFILIPNDLNSDSIFEIGDIDSDRLTIKASGESEGSREEGSSEASGSGSGGYYSSEYYSSGETESARESANETYERGEADRALESAFNEAFKSSEAEANLEMLNYMASQGMNLELVMKELNISNLSEFAKLPSRSIGKILKENHRIVEIKEIKENTKENKSAEQESESLKLLDMFEKALESGGSFALKGVEAGFKMVLGAVTSTVDAAFLSFFKNPEKTKSIAASYFYNRNGVNYEKAVIEFNAYRSNEKIFGVVEKMGITRADILRSSRGASEEHLLLKARPQDILANAKRAVQEKFGSGTKKALALEKERIRCVKEQLKSQQKLVRDRQIKEKNEKIVRELEAVKAEKEALIRSQPNEMMALEQGFKTKLQEIDKFFKETTAKHSQSPEVLAMLKTERARLETTWKGYLNNVEKTIQRHNTALEKNRLQNDASELLQLQLQLKKEIPLNESFLNKQAADLVKTERELLLKVNRLEAEGITTFRETQAYKEQQAKGREIIKSLTEKAQDIDLALKETKKVFDEYIAELQSISPQHCDAIRRLFHEKIAIEAIVSKQKLSQYEKDLIRCGKTEGIKVKNSDDLAKIANTVNSIDANAKKTKQNADELLNQINIIKTEKKEVLEKIREPAKIDTVLSSLNINLTSTDKIALEKAIAFANAKPPYIRNITEGNGFAEFVKSKLPQIYQAEFKHNPDNLHRSADAFAFIEKGGKEGVSLIEIMRSAKPFTFNAKSNYKFAQAESYGNALGYELVLGRPVEMKFIFSDLGGTVTDSQRNNVKLAVENGIKECVERRYTELIAQNVDPKILTKTANCNIQIEVWK